MSVIALRIIRRTRDINGREKIPAQVWDMEERGAVAIYLRCPKCQHKTEVPIGKVDPESFVPDVGLAFACEACGHPETESWPRYRSTIM